MRATLRFAAMALSVATSVAISGCSQGDTVAPGALVPADAANTAAPLYAPSDGEALAFGLPDVVQAVRLESSTDDALAAEEAGFAHDLVVKPILVSQGLGPNSVTIQQKSDRHDEIPVVGISAVWVAGVPADLFAEFDPSLYLLLTSVTPEQYRWLGEKPGRDRATIVGHDVWYSDWESFQVVWYTWGEVLYIVLAENQELLEATLRRMPWPSDTTPTPPEAAAVQDLLDL